ncbi:MAG: preprotein translocase subunit SecG, partial [Neisseriaceae bacterium]|nr:preprotein translocase subunit SecG [Neisseriaceae bacterium]
MSNTLSVLLWIINIFYGLSIIFLVLMQHGKGADAGAAFGGGSS